MKRILDYQRFARVKAAILAGRRYVEIATEEGCTVSYVCLIRIRAGIPRRLKPLPTPDQAAESGDNSAMDCALSD
jgi:hypothetical protein